MFGIFIFWFKNTNVKTKLKGNSVKIRLPPEHGLKDEASFCSCCKWKNHMTHLYGSFFFFLRRDLPQKRIDQRRSGKNFSGDIFSGEFTSYTI